MLLTGLALMVGVGCQDADSAGRAHLAKGNEYFAQKKFDEAAIEYRNAIQRTPNAPEAHFKLGEVLAAKSDIGAALGSYVRAADLRPDFADAQLKASHLLLLARSYDDARTRLRAVLAKEPGNASALLMLGNAMAGMGSMEEALAANRRAIALDPKRAGSYVNLGALQYQSGDKRESEAAFKAAIAADSRSLNARLGLADFYSLENRFDEALRGYEDALVLDRGDLRANRAIAAFHIRRGNLPAAEPYLRKVAETAKSAPDWYALADYYVATGRRRQALEILKGLRGEPPTYADASVKIAFMAALDRAPAQARQLVDEVLAKEPTHAAAQALKVHLLLGERKRVEALAFAEKAVAANRRSEAVHFAHAVAARANGRREVAKSALLEVLKLNGSSAEALIELTELSLDEEAVDTALDYAEQAVRTNPHLIEAHLMRLRVLADHSERSAEADKALVALLASYPNSPDVQQQAGLAAIARRDTAAASRHFSRARELRPNYLPSLIELIKLDVRANRVAQAKSRVDAVLRENPNAVELLLVAGNTYAMIDAEVAERHLRKVIQLDPSNLTAYQSLAALYLTRNQLDRARAEFVNLAAQEPTSVAPPTMVGILFEAQGNSAEAERWYKQALKINARAATAANNLAWMYAERGEQLDAAVELAEVAKSLLPRQAEVTDTLGWAYFKKGRASRAVDVLKDAIAQDAGNALYHYHLGLALAQIGEDARARTSLQQALTLDPKFAHAADARRALAKLLY